MYKPIPGRGNKDRDRAITLKVLEGVSVNKMAKKSKLSVARICSIIATVCQQVNKSDYNLCKFPYRNISIKGLRRMKENFVPRI
jgi:hypothetical protein